MSEFYESDLTYCHHVGFSDPDLPGAVIAELRRAGISKGRVVDLGCNGGELLRALADAGYAAVGIDVSAAAIALARETAPEAELHVAAAGACEIPSCQAVTALGEVLCYAPDGSSDTLANDEALRRIHRALAPGGLLLFDVLVTDPDNVFDYRTFREGPDWAVLLDVREETATARLFREITVFRRIGETWRRAAETHVLAVRPLGEIRDRLAMVGFEVETADAIGPVRMLPRRTVFICRKAAC